MSTTTAIQGWQLLAPGRALERREYAGGRLTGDLCRVRVAGCGLCHTDLGFQTGAVLTRAPLPLTLGHEIAGVVEDAGPLAQSLVGRSVIVPAVLPCGHCALCRSGRDTACPNQQMPGNDIPGGFASHLVVPGRHLSPVDPLPPGYELAELAVIADAVTTPYQAVRRAQVGPGDLAVFVGVGGIGSYGVQIARALGAAVVALDVDEMKLARASANGAGLTLSVGKVGTRELRERIRDFAREQGIELGWKIFETSGTPAGQELAFGLLGRAATLAVVGFTPEKVELRLSNLMAFDATAFGNWGCSPSLYPAALDLVRSGKVQIKPFIRRHPMSELNQLIERTDQAALMERPILIPDF